MDARDKFIVEHKDDFEEILKKLIALKSISATGEGIDETVQFLRNLLTKLLGAKVEIIPTAGNPVILANISGKENKNVLFYGHYDVMTPGDTIYWDSDPFELTKRNGHFYARGVGDNKGQLLAQILGMYTYLQIHHEFPFNVTLFIEGEEEQGSVNLEPTVKKIATTKLQKVDQVFVMDGAFNADGTHVLRLDNRGVFAFELSTTTGSHDNHSGNLGNIMDNPFVQLLKYLHKIYDFETGTVKLPHFYEGVEKPTEQEKVWIKQLPYDKESILQQSGIKHLDFDKETYYEKLMFEPTFNFFSVKSGYMEKGVKTIIPHQASLKVDCRLVGKQSITAIKQDLEKAFAKEIRAGDLELNYLGNIPPEHTEADLTEIEKIQQAIVKATGKAYIEPVMPGGVPNYVWKDNLHVPVFTIPYANYDEHNHDFNENLTEKAFYDGIKISYELLGLG